MVVVARDGVVPLVGGRERSVKRRTRYVIDWSSLSGLSGDCNSSAISLEKETVCEERERERERE